MARGSAPQRAGAQRRPAGRLHRDVARDHALPVLRLQLRREALRGLELARAWRPDVVLMDVLMPRLSGVEMADAMRRDPALRHLPIVSMSACPGQPAPRAANAHVPKPFAIGEIVAALRATLGAPAASGPPAVGSAQG